MSSLPPMQPDRDENQFATPESTVFNPKRNKNFERIIFVVAQIQAYQAKIEPLVKEADQMIADEYHKKHQHFISPKVAKRLHTHDWKKTEEELSKNPDYMAKCERINALIQEALSLVEERETLKGRLDFGHVRKKK